MKPKARNIVPAIVTLAVLAFVFLLHWSGEATKNRPEGAFRVDIFDRLESITYDARVRMAASALNTNDIATNLATVFIEDEAIERINDGMYSGYMVPAWEDGNIEGLEPAFPWPRFIYGQLIRELKTQGAKAVGFDVLFSETDAGTPETRVFIDETNSISSDEFFAQQIAAASNVVLATEGNLLPREEFARGALAIGNIASTNDYGVLRRVRAFGYVKEWHPAILELVPILKLKMKRAHFTNEGVLTIPIKASLEDPEPQPFIAPLLANGNLDLTKDGGINTGAEAAERGDTNQPPFRTKRAWNLGIVLAARELGIDLEKAEILPRKIILRGENGLVREIPTDENHYFYVDWSLRLEDIKKRRTPVHFGAPLDLLSRDFARNFQKDNQWTNDFTGRLVVIGSIATGNNVTDMGSTPIEEKTPLVTKHLNVANSILTGRFIQRTSFAGTLLLIAALGALSALVTWRSKVVKASASVAVLALAYVILAFGLFIAQRYWLPIVMPVFGGLLLPHFALVTYRVVFEQKEQRHIKGVFQKIVSPDVVKELLAEERLSLGGERQRITVYFADVRGFTEFTDKAQAEAEEYVRKHNLAPAQAEEIYNKQAADTLETVNRYLSTIADQIKKHNGTLDKYIGDCVMAFWGAPVFEEKHALCAVLSAIDSQRAMYALNQQRAAANEQRKTENVARAARGEEPLPLLPLLTLGSGINTGASIVGLMGSNEHILNYTVFGREVNVAARLEGVSGRGRIIVSYATYEEVKRFDPALAATFVELEPTQVKGISSKIRIFEVPWKQAPPAPAAAAAEAAPATAASPVTAPAAPVAARTA